MGFDRELLSLEAERKLFHIAWALLPLLYYLGYPREGMLLLLLLELVIWAGLETARKYGYSVFPERLMREHERKGRLMGTFFQIASMFLAVLLFDKTIAILAMLFNCLGDSITAYAGALLSSYISRERLQIREFRQALMAPGMATLRDDLAHALRHRKSPLLMAVMFTACMLVGLVAYPGISPALLAAGAAGAVLADAFAWRIMGYTVNDDLTITLMAGGALTLAAIF